MSTASSSGPSGPPGPPGSSGRAGRSGASGQPTGSSRLLRGALVLAAAVVIAVLVLARMGGVPSTAANAAKHSTTAPTTAAGGHHLLGTSTTLAGRSSSTTTATTSSSTEPTTTTLPSSSVLVQVLNGWTKLHAALYYKNQLAKYGYDLRTPLDAATSDNAASEVFYEHPQFEPSALAIASEIGVSASNVVSPTAANDSALTTSTQASSDVIVLVGEDISGRVPANYQG